jgi:hypothetical protein
MKTKQWVQCWAQAGKALEKIRNEEIRMTDTMKAVRSFEGILPSVLASHPPGPWSGLIEQQRIFSRLRHE